MITQTGYDWAPSLTCNSFILDFYTLNILWPLSCIFHNINLSHTKAVPVFGDVCEMSRGLHGIKLTSCVVEWVCFWPYYGASCKFRIAAYISYSWIDVAVYSGVVGTNSSDKSMACQKMSHICMCISWSPASFHQVRRCSTSDWAADYPVPQMLSLWTCMLLHINNILVEKRQIMHNKENTDR